MVWEEHYEVFGCDDPKHISKAGGMVETISETCAKIGEYMRHRDQ